MVPLHDHFDFRENPVRIAREIVVADVKLPYHDNTSAGEVVGPRELESQTATALGKRSDRSSSGSRSGVHVESKLASVAHILPSGAPVRAC